MTEPTSETELLERANKLAGLALGTLAARLSIPVPEDLKRQKGWVGMLLEKALGAVAASRAEPDFLQLGIELKSLPVDHRGRPVESTFVCSIALPEIADIEWEESRAWKKLRRVLWVPVQGKKEIAPADRVIGAPLLWSPGESERMVLRSDWLQLSAMIAEGRTAEITGHLGEALQVRPKAARGSSRRLAFDEDGAIYDEQPKGFYLRPSFTRALLEKHFVLPHE
ncbi:MAG: DNA mismatch repair endonuclease MutH [Polyangiaceae bacterium]|nr:DNA mismatch repair endonuclease MutH [Polyangiaceae bacterium]